MPARPGCLARAHELGQRGIRRVALERDTLTGEDVRAICDDPRDTRAADWVVKPNPRRDGS